MSRVAELSEAELADIARRRTAAREKGRELLERSDPVEDAAILRAAESDPDALPMTEDQLSRMRPAHEVHPHLVRRSLERKRGRPKLDAPKQQVTLRIDADILEYFKSQGAGWQTAMNETLRKGMQSS